MSVNDITNSIFEAYNRPNDRVTMWNLGSNHSKVLAHLAYSEGISHCARFCVEHAVFSNERELYRDKPKPWKKLNSKDSWIVEKSMLLAIYKRFGSYIADENFSTASSGHFGYPTLRLSIVFLSRDVFAGVCLESKLRWHVWLFANWDKKWWKP